ncbi:MAG: hypothetical protein JO051_09520 [Acidobacteriaceae bacterium]|nr:hypothetical protein [Acidobacteriaceae bacterium]
MRSLRSTVTLVSLVGLFTISLCGQGRSPSIIVNGDPPTLFTPEMSTAFMFGADNAGGGDLGFTNDTGQTWTRLDVFVTLDTFQSITCGSVSFGTCTVTTTTPPGASPASYDIIFGPNPKGGILDGQNFTIDLNDNGNTDTSIDGPGSWGAGRDFTAVANNYSPEPAPVALAGLGLLLLGSGRFFVRRFRAKALL